MHTSSSIIARLRAVLPARWFADDTPVLDALLAGLDERLRHETGMPIHITDRPLDSVAMGSGKCVEEFEALQQVLISEPRH